jgi:hypothetical protein
VQANRAFLARAVRYLVAECGIRQFLDIGTGLPTASNTHEVAQATAPDARIVYVDNDPIVLARARALLTSTPEGATARSVVANVSLLALLLLFAGDDLPDRGLMRWSGLQGRAGWGGLGLAGVGGSTEAGGLAGATGLARGTGLAGSSAQAWAGA